MIGLISDGIWCKFHNGCACAGAVLGLVGAQCAWYVREDQWWHNLDGIDNPLKDHLLPLLPQVAPFLAVIAWGAHTIQW